jgi:hypothetical protein
MKLTTVADVTLFGAVVVGLVVMGLWSLGLLGLTSPERLLGTLAIIALGALAAGGAGRLSRMGAPVALMTSGAGAALLAMLSWLAVIHWPDDAARRMSSPLVASAISLAAWSGFVLVTGLLLAQPTSSRILRGLRNTAIGLLGLVFGVSIVVVWLDPWMSSPDTAYRVLIGLSAMTGGVVAIALLAGRLAALRRADNEMPAGERLVFRAKCPRCGARQALRTGGDHCAECGLAIKVTAP